MLRLFDEIPLDTGFDFDDNASGFDSTCLYLAVMTKCFVDRVQDVKRYFERYIARRNLYISAEPSLRLITDTFAFARLKPQVEHDFDFRLYIRRSRLPREIAFALADGIAYR